MSGVKQSRHRGISPEEVSRLPTTPGVYLLKNGEGEVLYIGKAKNLRARVRSYFDGSDERAQIPFLVARVREIETVVTADERMALRLEADLIRKRKPRYNIRLKDDKGYLLVRVELTHQWPRLELVRHRRDDGAKYIGPFVFSYELRAALDAIRKVIPLRTCSDQTLGNRVRPCLEYQIKRCAGPCCLPVSPEDYMGWVGKAIAILEGRAAELVKELTQRMLRASDALHYEEAAILRDQIKILEKLSSDRTIASATAESMDVIGLYREGSNAEVSVLLVREGRIVEARNFSLSDVVVTEGVLLESVIGQLYESELPPEEVVTSIPPEDESLRLEDLRERHRCSVRLVVPQRGSKLRLLELAQENAYEHFRTRRPRASDVGEEGLHELQMRLELESVPRVIDCIDVSHFQGGSTVGVVVSLKDGRVEKSRQRKFILSQEGKPDDFASMKETVRRYLSMAVEENALPDLMVIDGGPAQLSMAVAARKECGLSQPPMIGLAKKRLTVMPSSAISSTAVSSGAQSSKPKLIPVVGDFLGGGRRKGKEEGGAIRKPERVFQESGGGPLLFSAGSQALRALEQVRDEAHRVAVTFHRNRRSKKLFHSELDTIPGVGPERRLRLLRTFGSLRALREASPEEIQERAKIPLPVAQRICERLNKSTEEET